MDQDRKIECKTSGSPLPAILWTFGGTPIEKVLEHYGVFVYVLFNI